MLVAANELTDDELIPKRSARLAAKSRHREPRPEVQARKVMMKKLGVEVPTEHLDEASFNEFQTAFTTPLPDATREAMQVLVPCRKLRTFGSASAALVVCRVSLTCFLMLGQNIFTWNVRGLNSRARRDVVRSFLLQERVFVACLVETKVDVMDRVMLLDLMGAGFDYFVLPAVGASGGIIVAWSCGDWSVARHSIRNFTLTINIHAVDGSSQPWSLCAVYGPVDDNLEPDFLAEIREVGADFPSPLLFSADFNMIYRAQDKNNNRLNLAAMRRFRRALDAMALDELYLHGRLYTWSNERVRLTLERLDRAFATLPWLELFPDHRLRALSSECSDHSPLLLQLHSEARATPSSGLNPSGCALMDSWKLFRRPGNQ